MVGSDWCWLEARVLALSGLIPGFLWVECALHSSLSEPAGGENPVPGDRIRAGCWHGARGWFRGAIRWNHVAACRSHPASPPSPAGRGKAPFWASRPEWIRMVAGPDGIPLLASRPEWTLAAIAPALPRFSVPRRIPGGAAGVAPDQNGADPGRPVRGAGWKTHPRALGTGKDKKTHWQDPPRKSRAGDHAPSSPVPGAAARGRAGSCREAGVVSSSIQHPAFTLLMLLTAFLGMEQPRQGLDEPLPTLRIQDRQQRRLLVHGGSRGADFHHPIRTSGVGRHSSGRRRRPSTPSVARRRREKRKVPWKREP